MQHTAGLDDAAKDCDHPALASLPMHEAQGRCHGLAEVTPSSVQLSQAALVMCGANKLVA